jgi:hypothetical protein
LISVIVANGASEWHAAASRPLVQRIVRDRKWKLRR